MTSPQAYSVPAPKVFDAGIANVHLKNEKFVKTADTDSIYVLDLFHSMKCTITCNPTEEPFETPLQEHYLLLQPSSGKPAWMSPTLPETLSGFVLVSVEEMAAVLKDALAE